MFTDPTNSKPTVIILCGPPGSGKSTLVKAKMADQNVLSSDAILMAIAQKHGISYSEAFKTHGSEAFAEYERKLRECINSKESFVIDRTNLTVKSRRATINKLNGYYKVAVYFGPTNPTTLIERVTERTKINGHNVPAHVIESMAISYQIPSVEEGFDKVIASGAI